MGMNNREQSEAFIKMLTGSIDYAMKEFDLTNAQIVGAIEISKQLFLNQLLWGAATVDDLPEEEVEYEYEEEEDDDEGDEWKA
jgi:hypothetical protein